MTKLLLVNPGSRNWHLFVDFVTFLFLYLSGPLISKEYLSIVYQNVCRYCSRLFVDIQDHCFINDFLNGRWPDQLLFEIIATYIYLKTLFE